MEATNNMKAMRESIMYAIERLENMYKATDLDGLVHIINVLKSSLSSPLRNCDVGTADEQNYRHGLWCSKHDVNGDMEADCANNACSQCILKWCQMPYEKGDNA